MTKDIYYMNKHNKCIAEMKSTCVRVITYFIFKIHYFFLYIYFLWALNIFLLINIIYGNKCHQIDNNWHVNSIKMCMMKSKKKKLNKKTYTWCCNNNVIVLFIIICTKWEYNLLDDCEKIKFKNQNRSVLWFAYKFKFLMRNRHLFDKYCRKGILDHQIIIINIPEYLSDWYEAQTLINI